jgi:hypothetical protein
MNALNPANVPETGDPRWIIASKQPCSPEQQRGLQQQLRLEGMKPADLFGDGFSSISEVSRWAAHWAIDLLNSRLQARAVERQRVDYEERKEHALKGWIADYYKAQHAHLRSFDGS